MVVDQFLWLWKLHNINAFVSSQALAGQEKTLNAGTTGDVLDWATHAISAVFLAVIWTFIYACQSWCLHNRYKSVELHSAEKWHFKVVSGRKTQSQKQESKHGYLYYNMQQLTQKILTNMMSLHMLDALVVYWMVVSWFSEMRLSYCKRQFAILVWQLQTSCEYKVDGER